MTIAQLQVVSLEELLSVLMDCSEQLFLASQESNNIDWWKVSQRAERAKEYLSFVLHQKNGIQLLH